MRHRVAGFVVMQLLVVATIAEISGAQIRPQNSPIWTVPEVGALPRDAYGIQIRTGRDLVTATYAYIGPNAPDASNRYAGNNLEQIPVDFTHSLHA
jgi:thiosulfate dehydrogenase